MSFSQSPVPGERDYLCVSASIIFEAVVQAARSRLEDQF
jgi:hypothetical protein